jgi:hypothetical protein
MPTSLFPYDRPSKAQELHAALQYHGYRWNLMFRQQSYTGGVLDGGLPVLYLLSCVVSI